MNLRHAYLGAAIGLTLLAASCSSDDDVMSGDTVASTERSTAAPATSATTATTDADSPDESVTTDTELDLEERAGDIRDALSNGDFSTTLDLLELSGLADEIEGREVTVLAPDEAAFSDLSADDLSELITDPESAKDLLRRHVIDGLYTYDELAALQEVTTISDETLTITTSGDQVMVDGATVSPSDLDGLAGEDGQEIAVFGIDRLLLEL
jgi:uncharacterized surface protein with fasciclin (FAS1) repeats